MSRRSRLTVEILIRMPLPAGVKPASIAHNIKRGLFLRLQECENADPFKALSIEQAVITLVKRETVYL